MMPGMDGIALLQAAREKVPTAARVLCTAAEDFRIALDAVNSGEVYRIISKPWHNQEVVTTVAQAADASRLRRENERLNIQVQQQNDKLRELNLRLEERVRERTEALLGGLIPDLTIIEHGALLHDIGKIGIRDRVLLKPGPLDASEWKEMKRHPELGWELLRRVEYLKPSSIIVLQHQEKWDGTGYPGGLKGDGILIGARVFHVVDAYDAITSDRPYRKARGYADARSEITRCRGAQFDPVVVDAFLDISEEEWRRISIDVEQYAILSTEMAERPPGTTGPIPLAQA
jgi:response regulator RpfG family c-di-GMP phosphodiesterase